jgi:ABC-type lipoprotein release transport system permease subunit
MRLGRLLWHNLQYHWRGNSAVFLGVVVGAAVLTGALLVGDALRGSLKDLALRQLGWVDQALVAGRFFRAELADSLPADHACPALLLRGAASRDSAPPRRAGRVMILGVDERFWPTGGLPLEHEFWRASKPNEAAQSGVVLNSALAHDLGVEVGDRVNLHLQKASDVPRETLLGRRDTGEVLDTLRLTVQAVLGDDSPGGRFTLTPTPETPRNAFVPLGVLQARLGLEGRANALLAGGARGDLQQSLRKNLTLDDWGLLLQGPEDRARALMQRLDPRSRGRTVAVARLRGRTPAELTTFPTPVSQLTRAQVAAFYRKEHGYLDLQSRQMLLDETVARAALAAAEQTGLRTGPTLIYLADTISDGTHDVPYSVVAALDSSESPPLGPFLPANEGPLRDDEILLADWPDSPLQVKPGDKVTLTYYLLEQHDRLEKKTASFTLRAKVPLAGAADDPDLTPEFRGITDKLDISNWENPPFPYDNRRITPADEKYWTRYRATPKAYITLTRGQQLWGSRRFGELTSIRLAPKQGAGLDTAAQQFSRRLLDNLDPEQGGLVFDAVRDRALRASAGGTDFEWLFLGFSCFLIIAALLLVGLLFRLNLDRRAAEIGVLFAAGYRRRTVGLLLLAEGVALAAAGAAVGCLAARGYAWLLLQLLQACWPRAMHLSFLTLHDSAQSFAFGFVASLLVCALTIAAAVWGLSRVAPRSLLAGETSGESAPTGQRKPPRWSLWIAGTSAVTALVLVPLGGFVRDDEMRAMTFFGSGALLLIAALAGLWAWMRSTRHRTVAGHGFAALSRLGARNGARNPLRSILTAGLLASAAFLIVAVESFHRQSGSDFLDKNAGSGGFTLLAESDVPLFQDLNGDKGREQLIEQLQQAWQQPGSGVGQPMPARLDVAREQLKGVEFYPFRVRAGDDASCLNLYQPRRPRLLGVPPSLVERGGFRIADTEANSADERANPWLLLDRQDDAIPVFGEANTVVWMLKSKLGGELEVPDERGRMIKLRVVGLLQDSVFQSGLLMSERNFLKLYPGEEGYRLFLIDTRGQRPDAIKSLLETALAERGLEVTPTADRLQEYLAVENTYLLTFQVLGGLGLLLGALGLAVVLLRGVWERRGELALLRALGYQHRALGWLVLAENGFLLLLGLGAGTAAALLAVAPHLLGGAGEVPLVRLLAFLALVLAVGLASGAAAVRATLRAPLLPALRRE